ncbi:MAG: hypothetical protein CMH52_08905 [Myxococcales bacterium]|nr:hypothetical protein [Myxococcales bacterium]|tara:strand:- start:566 stop:1228 length:663 start_codon:yes stop_codon:yes gene_type:complete
MGRIILTIAGSWDTIPAFNTELHTEVKGPDRDFAEDFVFVGQRAQVLDDSDIEQIRKHTHLIHAGVVFDGETRSWAQKAAQFAMDAVHGGATGVFVETACKTFTKKALSGLTPTDPHSLFHLFVEVMGDATHFSTEGMHAFGLAEVKAPYSPLNRESAQAAVISLAAQMVCERFRPIDGGYFRASESAPLYEVTQSGVDGASSDDPYANPLPPWYLQLSD